MSSLAAKYEYLEKFTRKRWHSEEYKLTKRDYVLFQSNNKGGPHTKKQKNKHDPRKRHHKKINFSKPNAQRFHKPATVPAIQPEKQEMLQQNTKVPGSKTETFNAVDILKQRLYEKIEASRGQGPPKDSSSEEVQKRRAKRKQERERKKRKRKEFRMKKLAECSSVEVKIENETEVAPVTERAATDNKKETSAIVFNKVEVGEEYVDKATKLNEKKKRRAKGTLTPLTGRNFKQLLSRVEARKAHLEELREKDEKKAKKEEEKMRWTNVLYKAEGMKIKDNEDLLRASLKRKEKIKMRRKKKWSERSQHVLEKMQQRQDKRRRNIQRSKQGKVEKRKQKARKKGRVLSEDLKKARERK